MQSLVVGIIDSPELSARQSDWTVRSTPTFSVELPRTAAVTITLNEGTIGKVSVKGDLEVDQERSNGNVRVLRWSANARESEHGGGSVFITNADGKLQYSSVQVVMYDDATVKVEVITPSQKPYFGIELVDRYGAYAAVALCALGALLFALLMPAHQAELVSGAGGIALWGWIITEEKDSYLSRLLAFAVAFVIMLVGLLLPQYAVWAITAAGTACAIGIYWGDEDLDEVKDLLPFSFF